MPNLYPGYRFKNKIRRKPTGFSQKTQWVILTKYKIMRTAQLYKVLLCVQLLAAVLQVIPLIPLQPEASRKRKTRVKKQDLPYHKRRRRVDWFQWVRELGPEDFYRHHRMTQPTFEKLLKILLYDIERDVRKSRYGDGPVTPRMRLTITLKHLSGSSTHDIEKQMGGKIDLFFLFYRLLRSCCSRSQCACLQFPGQQSPRHSHWS